MAEKLLNRVIVCVDGAEFDENGTLGMPCDLLFDEGVC